MEMEQKAMLIHAVKTSCGVNDMDLLLHRESNFNWDAPNLTRSILHHSSC